MSVSIVKFVAYLRGRPIVSSGILLIVLLAGANYYLWNDRKSITERLEAAQQKGEFMLRALSGRQQVDANLAALREAIAQIEGNLLEEQSMEVNHGYFYRYERTTRVRLVRINQLASLAPAAGSRFKVVSFSLQVTGSYRNNMSFLRALETGPRILRIRNCAFERMEKDKTESITLDLLIDVLAKA
ncbi:MAG: hypothetical protein V4773_08640 [Verrucomicrobiota bacterium]